MHCIMRNTPPFAQAKEAEDAERRRQGAAMLAAQLAQRELQKMLEEEQLDAVRPLSKASSR